MNLSTREAQAVGYALGAIANYEDALVSTPDDEHGQRIVSSYQAEARELVEDLGAREHQAVCLVINPKRLDAVRGRE